MKKNTLNTSAAFEGLVLGISASVKDYRLCHFINKKLNVNLQKPEPETGDLGATDQQPLKFQPFTFIDEHENWGFNFYLVPNKKEQGFWYPKYKNVNFILILPGANAQANKSWLLEQLQSISIIQAIFQVEGDHFKTLKALNLD